jgi:broad specificity phosphatase PhoE
MHQIILVRHGQTEANVAGRWQGQGHDGVLTPQGQRQIEALAARLRAERNGILAIYTSPLGRARKTAQAIGAAVDLVPIVEDDLKEMNFGQLDSWTMSEIAEKQPDFFAAWRDIEDRDLAWPEGERRRDFWERVAASYDRVLERHSEESIVIVAHGGSLRVGLGHLLGWPPSILNSYKLYNCSLTRLVYEYERWRLLTLNDVCHLEAEGLLD